ncbi:ribulose bisphosphate carboxylase small chain [Pseudoscourfieldia marina]
MQSWPMGEKKYENMSFLPPLTNEEIAKQVQYLVSNGWVPCIEYTHPQEGFARGGNSATVNTSGYYDNRYWTMYKLPMYGCNDPNQVLEEIFSCKAENPGCFIRLLGFDNVRQVQCAGLIIVRPDQP